MRWGFLLLFVGAIVWVLLNREPDSKPAPPPPPPSAPAVLNPELVGRLQAAARQVGVELRAVQPRQGGAELTVAWSGDVATRGGDFLEQCLNENLIKDFDPNTKPLVALTENGRRLVMASYQVRF